MTDDELYLRYVQNCKLLWGTTPASPDLYERELAKLNGFGGVFSAGMRSFLITSKNS